MFLDLDRVVKCEPKNGEHVDFYPLLYLVKGKDVSNLKVKETESKVIKLFSGLVFMIFQHLCFLELCHLNK